MIRRVLSCLAALAALVCPLDAAAAQSFIWKATSPTGGTVYLAGSVHLLTADYYPLAPAFEEAFAKSDLLVEEVDMGDLLSASAQMRMLTRGMLPPGRSLSQVVSATTLASVGQALAALGVPFEPLKQFKPWMLAMTLQSLAWQQAGFDANLGLDKHFYDAAQAAGRDTQGLETLDFQISRFDEIPPSLQELMLAETAKDLATTKESFARLAEAWKAGDAPAIEREVVAELKSQPEMYQRLLVDRNRLWLPTIESLFSRPRPSFVVVGAAHLVGADGLLQMLKARGYSLEQL